MYSEGVTLAVKYSSLELIHITSVPNPLTKISHVLPPKTRTCSPIMYSEGTRTRNIWQTMLMTITFFSEGLMCQNVLSVRIEDVGSISRSQRFRDSFTSKSGAISPKPLYLLAEDQLLLFSLLCPIVVQFHGPISSPSQQSGNKLILTAAPG